MKKSAIALAVAGACTGFSAVTQADTILYGSARVSVDYNSRTITDTGRELSTWDLVDNTSRLGVRGSEDLGNGLSAIYQFEFGVDPTEGGNFQFDRPKLVGLQSDRLGTLTVGNQWTPYYNVAGVSDVFNSGQSFFTGQYIGIYRLDNTVFYQSPDLYGFNFQGMVDINGVDGSPNQFGNTDRGADLWNLAGIYRNGPLFVGLTYIKLEGDEDPQPGFAPGDRDQYAAGLGYTMGPIAATFTFEYGDLLNTIGELDTTVTTGDNRDYYATLAYTLGSNVIRAGGGKTRFAPDGLPSFWVDNYLLGLEHAFSQRSFVWLEYLRRDTDNEARFLIPDRNVVSIGIRHDF